MRRAFTMLELIIVLIVIGVIAAIAAPRMSRAAESARFANTNANFNAILRAAEYYRAERGAYPPDYYQRSSHALFRPYMNTAVFLAPTPIGGDWDWNNRTNLMGGPVAHWATIGPNISINRASPPLALWQRFDATFDDGNLSTGVLRRERTTFLVMRVLDAGW